MGPTMRWTYSTRQLLTSEDIPMLNIIAVE